MCVSVCACVRTYEPLRSSSKTVKFNTNIFVFETYSAPIDEISMGILEEVGHPVPGQSLLAIYVSQCMFPEAANLVLTHS